MERVEVSASERPPVLRAAVPASASAVADGDGTEPGGDSFLPFVDVTEFFLGTVELDGERVIVVTALDVVDCTIAKTWAIDCNFLEIEKGWIGKRQIWNETPRGIRGIAPNQRRWPLGDRRVREAFAYLYPREKINKTVYFGQYVSMDSLWPNSMYASKENVRFTFRGEPSS